MNKRRSPYRHVVFDCDGTLMDSSAACLASAKQAAFEALGVELSHEQLVMTFALPSSIWPKRLGIGDERQLAELGRLIHQYYVEYAVSNTMFDGVESLLDTLGARSISQGLVTNRSAQEMREPLCVRLRERMRFCVTRDMVSRPKPDSEPLEVYLQRTGIQKHELIFVGDTDADADCAKNAGVDFALALWGTHTPDLDATYKFEHPMDLLEVLG